MHASGTSPAHSLSDECKAAHSLLQLLKQEQARLIDADVDGLAKLTDEKGNLAQQMSELAKRRHSMLAVAGFEATETGMQTWLKSAAATPNDAKLWNELLAVAQSAKELNRVNGLLITQHMARNQTALNLLQGNGKSGNFYGPNGRSKTITSSGRVVIS